MVDYCLNTSTIRECNLNLEEEVKLAARSGYQGIEIWFSEIEAYLKSEDDIYKLKKILDNNKINPVNLIAFPKWAHPNPDFRFKALKEAKRIFEIAKILGSTYVAAPPAGITEMQDIPLKQISECYLDLISTTKHTGVKPLLEFWGHSKVLNSLKEAVKVLDIINEPDKALLIDIFHMAKTENSFKHLRNVEGKRVGLVHFNDYPTTSNFQDLTDQHRIFPGDGVAPLKNILNTLWKIRYTGMFSLELFNQEYQRSGADQVARIGLEKMKQAIKTSSYGKVPLSK